MNIRFEPLHGKEETALGKAIICCSEENLHKVKEKILVELDSKEIPYFITREDNLFSWDEIPGNDNGKLVEFMGQKYGIYWAKTAKIKKIDDGRTIIVSNEKNSLSLRLNDEKTKVNLKIDDGGTFELNARTENSKLNIYDIFNETKFRQALNKASCGVITLTPQSINSPWILFESGVLIGRKIPIIPFQMDVSDKKQLPGFIEQYQLVKDIDTLIDLVSTHIYKFSNIFGKEYKELNNKILNKLNQVKLTLKFENVDKDLQNNLRFGYQIIRFGTWNLIKNEPKYLFSWDEVPGNDNIRLLEFLKQNFNIDWVEIAKVEKFEDGRTIKISAENDSLSLRLNNEKTEVNLKIEDGRTDKFIVKTENGTLKIKNSEMDETDRIHKINFIDKISYETNTNALKVEYILPVHRKWGLTFKLFVDVDNLEKLNTVMSILERTGYQKMSQSKSGEKQRIYFLIPDDKCKIVEEPDKILNNYLNPFAIANQKNNFQNV